MSELSEQNSDNNELSEQVEGKELDGKENEVKYDTFQRVLRQKKAMEEKLAKFEKLEEERRMKEEASKQERLREQQKYEELSKDLQEKLEQERSAKENFKKSWLDTHKLQAVLDKLPGKPKRQEYLSFIDLDKIEIDEHEGIVADTVEEVANSFIENYGELLSRPKSSELPSDAPSSKGKLSYEAWSKLPLADKKARLKDVMD